MRPNDYWTLDSLSSAVGSFLEEVLALLYSLFMGFLDQKVFSSWPGTRDVLAVGRWQADWGQPLQCQGAPAISHRGSEAQVASTARSSHVYIYIYIQYICYDILLRSW